MDYSVKAIESHEYISLSLRHKNIVKCEIKCFIPADDIARVFVSWIYYFFPKVLVSRVILEFLKKTSRSGHIERSCTLGSTSPY